MIGKLLVANRGEIALRVMRTARAMDVATVAVFSDPDADAPFVVAADEAVHLPGAAPGETYLRGDLIVQAALTTGAECAADSAIPSAVRVSRGSSRPSS